MRLRLGDQLFVSPNAVFDQSLLAIKPAISFFVEGAGGCCFAPALSNDILMLAYGTGGKQGKRALSYNGIGAKVDSLRSRTGAKPRARSERALETRCLKGRRANRPSYLGMIPTRPLPIDRRVFGLLLLADHCLRAQELRRTRRRPRHQS